MVGLREGTLPFGNTQWNGPAGRMEPACVSGARAHG